MPTDKDKNTERLRSAVIENAGIRETDRADLGLTTLSFQSLNFPNRHVWFDSDLGGEIAVDLEDWEIDESWDNSVANLTVRSLEEAASVITSWLSGGSIDYCRKIAK